VLGKDLFTVHGHIKNSATAAHQIGRDPELLFDLFCQTGSSWIVVSLYAILDTDFHFDSPAGRSYLAPSYFLLFKGNG